MNKPLTTRYAAKKAGLSLITLQRWIAEGKVRPPRLQILNGRAARVWDEDSVARLRQIKEKIYCRGRGRKKRTER